jgi:ATP-dependent helicase/nuclease subunit B
MRLMDEAETEDVDLSRMAELVPERFAGHEQLSLSFLNIVVEAWPAFLAEQKLINPVERRNRLMALEAERLRRTHPDTPVIVAGSTGSIPATAELMKAVAGLPNGAIVLPGLDLTLDDPSWNAITEHPEHPQAGLLQLLADLAVPRADVKELGGHEPAPEDAAKVRLLSEALRPAATLGAWPGFMASASAREIEQAFASVSLISAPTEQDEAAAIALIMREAMETPGRTANLVTPDRALTRRVSAELHRWGLKLDASSGEPLLSTPAGIFHDLIADAAATGDQIALLALMKHNLTRLGMPEGAARRAARIIEIAAMRQPWCGEGVAALMASLDETQKARPRHAAIERLTGPDWDDAYEGSRRGGCSRVLPRSCCRRPGGEGRNPRPRSCQTRCPA